MKPHELRCGESEEPANGIGEKEELIVGHQQSAALQPLKIPPILLEGDQPSSEPGAPDAQKHTTGSGSSWTSVAPEGGDLPEAYGTGRLWLAARDPHCLYAHWDLTSEQERQHRSRAQDSPLLVKVYQENRPQQPVSEIEVQPELRHSFIHVDVAGAKYVAELGYNEANREWTPISVSNETTVPAETVAEETGFEFATIPVDQPIEAGSGPIERPTNREPISAGPVKGIIAEPQPVRADLPAFLAEHALAGGTAQLHRAERWLQARQPAGDLQLEFHMSPEVEPPAPAREWTATQERALAQLTGWSLESRGSAGSAEISEMIRGRPEPPSAQAAQLELPGPSSLITSPVGGGPPPPRGFWFNVNAELVVYGATEPNAQVTLGARPVQLRADGTFSFRFALPDGKFVLVATAYSAGGDIRRADLEFQRVTRYYGEVGVQPPDPGLGTPLQESPG